MPRSAYAGHAVVLAACAGALCGMEATALRGCCDGVWAWGHVEVPVEEAHRAASPGRAHQEAPLTGSIAGFVQDSKGTAIGDVKVFAFPKSWITDDGTRAVPRPVVSDRNGAFSITNLPPGEYLLLAAPGDRDAAGVAVEMSGRLLDFGGSATVDAGTAKAGAQHRTTVVPPTFYPGTPVAGEAAVVLLDPAQVVSGLVIVVQRVPTGDIGVVAGGGGADQRIDIFLHQLDVPRLAGGHVASLRQVAADGVMWFRDVPPGRYRVRVTGRSVSAGLPGIPDVPLRDQADVTLLPNANVRVGLALQPTIAVEGRVYLEDPAGSIRSGSAIEVVLRRHSPISGPFRPMVVEVAAPLAATVDESGRFRFDDVPPGRYQVEVNLTGSAHDIAARWTVGIVRQGAAVSDPEITVSYQDQSSITIVVQQRH